MGSRLRSVRSMCQVASTPRRGGTTAVALTWMIPSESAAARVLNPRRRWSSADGRSGANSREDSGGAGRGEVRSPGPASPPSQVRGPGPDFTGPGSAGSRRETAEQHTEERAPRGGRRAGGLDGASVSTGKLGAGEWEPEGAPLRGPSTDAAARSGRSNSSKGDSGDPVPPVLRSWRPRAAGGRSSGTRDSRSGGSSHRGTSGVPAIPAGDPRDLRTAADLPSLAARLEQHAAAWSREGDVRTLRAAFDILGKMGTPGSGIGEAHRLTDIALRALVPAYLALVPQLPDAYSCVVPLLACARLDSWGNGLALALVKRLWEADARGVRVLRRRDDARIHANLWWALSSAPRDLLGAADEVLRESAACLQRMEPKQLNAQACSNVLIACARLRWYTEPDLVHHLTASLVGLPDADCQALANAMYSLGELAEDCGHEPRRRDLKGLAKQVAGRLERALGFGESEQRDRPGHSVMQRYRQGSQGSFIPQHLSNMLLGCAKLGYREPELLQPLAAAAGQAACLFNSQELANSLYALAKLGCTGAEYALTVRSLCDGVVVLLRQAPNRFKPQGLSNLLWALEGLRPEGSQEYARALLEECMGCGLSGFKPQELSNILLALEGLRPEGFGEYAAAVAAECKRRDFADFQPQSISNSVWALAKMDSSLVDAIGWVPDHSWYKAAVQAAGQQGVIKGLKPVDWSNLLYSLALVRHRPDAGLLRAMAEGVQQGLLGTLRADANSQECANMLWALAVLGLGSEQELVDALAGRLGELLERDPGLLVEQDLASTLWALAVMGPEVLVHRHGALVGELLWEVAGRQQQQNTAEVPFTVEQLSQLWQVQQELQHAAEAASGDDSSVRDLAAVLAGTSLIKDGRPMGNSRTSRTQRQVAASLRGLQQKLARDSAAPYSISSVRQEYEVEGLGCRVDVLVDLAGGRHVAVEVDGPWHFLAHPPRVKDGPTRLRDWQLERVFGAGNVVSVPYWEWDELGDDEDRQRKYLAGLLGLKGKSS